MKEIQYEIVKEIAVLSTSGSGYTKEINLISWNGKLSVSDFVGWERFQYAPAPCHKGMGTGDFKERTVRLWARIEIKDRWKRENAL